MLRCFVFVFFLLAATTGSNHFSFAFLAFCSFLLWQRHCGSSGCLPELVANAFFFLTASYFVLRNSFVGTWNSSVSSFVRLFFLHWELVIGNRLAVTSHGIRWMAWADGCSVVLDFHYLFLTPCQGAIFSGWWENGTAIHASQTKGHGESCCSSLVLVVDVLVLVW